MGEAGFPVLVLLILNAVVLASWIIWGRGNKITKVMFLVSTLIVFSVLIILSSNLDAFPLVRDIVQIVTIIFPILSLFIPGIYNIILNGQNTN